MYLGTEVGITVVENYLGALEVEKGMLYWGGRKRTAGEDGGGGREGTRRY